jgi:replicative DNA helicase
MIGVDKIPPHSIKAEEAVLGSVILEASCLDDIDITHNMFYKEENSIIFKVITDIKNRGESVDMITVTRELQSLGKLDSIGGAYRITELSMMVTSAVNIISHAQIIKATWILREQIRLGYELIKKGFDEEDAREEIPRVVAELNAALSTIVYGREKNPETMNHELYEHINNVASGVIKGIRTGFSGFDEITGGMQDSDLIVIGSYPSNGKTATAVNIFTNTMLNGVKGKMYSLEQVNKQIYMRQVGILSQVSSSKILKEPLSQEEMDKVLSASGRLSKLKSLYEDKLSYYEDISSDIRRSINEGVKYVIIDYLQLIKTKERGDRKDKMGYIANSLKTLANELNIPIILVSQLRRPSSTQERPMVHMLKESGDIENAADIIWLPWIPINAPTYYDEPSIRIGGVEYQPQVGEDKLMYHYIDKGRNYGTTQWASVIDSTMKITDYEVKF